VSSKPEVEVSIQAHQGDLLLLVPEAKGERWQFYFNDAFAGKNKAWAEGYATSRCPVSGRKALTSHTRVPRSFLG
jgi:hypothetical protein